LSGVESAAPPRARIELRPVGAARGITITVVGPINERDADELGRHLQAALDAGPTVLVVNLSGVPRCEPAGVQVLAEARDRARHRGVALHPLHLGDPEARRWLAAAGLDTGRPSLGRLCPAPRRGRTRRRRPRGASCAPA
jgi:anti-anti-sigma regulatory factor